MKKTIELDGDNYEVAFDAYFPIFYRDDTGLDFFEDEEAITQGDKYAAIKMAYVAVKYGTEGFDKSYEDWLKEYDLMSIIDFAVEAILFMRSTYKQKSQSKKK